MSYQIDGEEVGDLAEEVATWDTLTLTFRVPADTRDQYLKPLESDAGSVDVLATDDGGFRAVDRAGNTVTIDLTPPPERQPLREPGTYYVTEYEDEQVGPEAAEYDVTLSLVPETARSLVGLGLEESGVWELETEEGTIGTERVEARILSRGEEGTEEVDLTATLTAEQAEAFERSVARLNAVRRRDLPDAADRIVDDADGQRNAVGLTPPGESSITPRQYVPREWESDQLNNDFQKVDMTLAPLIRQLIDARASVTLSPRTMETIGIGETARASVGLSPRTTEQVGVGATARASVTLSPRATAGVAVALTARASVGLTPRATESTALTTSGTARASVNLTPSATESVRTAEYGIAQALTEGGQTTGAVAAVSGVSVGEAQALQQSMP